MSEHKPLTAEQRALLMLLDAITPDTPRALAEAVIIEAEKFLADAAARLAERAVANPKESRRVH